MKLEKDNVILSRSSVAFTLHYELQQIACWATTQSPEKLAYHQNMLEGMLSVLNLAPADYKVIMVPVRKDPTRENIEAAFQRIVKVFGESDMTLEEMTGYAF